MCHDASKHYIRDALIKRAVSNTHTHTQSAAMCLFHGNGCSLCACLSLSLSLSLPLPFCSLFHSLAPSPSFFQLSRSALVCWRTNPLKDVNERKEGEKEARARRAGTKADEAEMEERWGSAEALLLFSENFHYENTVSSHTFHTSELSMAHCIRYPLNAPDRERAFIIFARVN